MKSRKALATTIILFIGVAIGTAITLLLLYVAARSYSGSRTELTNQPRTFGDIKIWAQRPKTDDKTEIPEELLQEHAKELWMTKDDVPFLMISQNKANKASCLCLVKNNKEPVFYMSPFGRPGKWGQATYSKSSGAGYAVGDVFVDIDFDGHFDFKIVMDEKGKPISRSIFVDGSWRNINSCNIGKMKAATGQMLYTFDPNAGFWKREQ